MKAIRDHISVKLLLSYIGVLLVGTVVLYVAVMFTAPGAYNRHMGMDIQGMDTLGSHMPGMMGQGQNLGSGLAAGPGFNNFRASMFEALSYAFIAALIVAVTLSFIFSKQIIAPLQAMMGASQRIADGRFDERVMVSGSDELAQLAERFNRMAERLEQTEAMRRQLIGDVSHELRTPLTAIGGFMEGLSDGVLPASVETFEQVRMEASRLSRLVDDLQELSRVESGSYRLNIHPVNLIPMLQIPAKRLTHQFAEKKVSLSINNEVNENAQSTPMVMADEDRIIQVMTNLLANALVYTNPGGEVSISVQRTGAEMQVAIKDNGIGIPEENIDHIFDRFYRVDKSRSRIGGGGSGIGLTIAKAIVEAHRGRIWVESAGNDRGSTFKFTLPISG
jgi:histidine kinase